MIIAPRTCKKLLALSAAVAFTVTVLFSFWTYQVIQSPQKSFHSGSPSVENQAQNNRGDELDYTASQIEPSKWVLQLQRPLFDPPPAPEPTPPPPPPLKIELIGTVIGGSNLTAMIQVPRQGIQLVEVGQTIEQAQITRIEADRIYLIYHGQERVLEQKK